MPLQQLAKRRNAIKALHRSLLRSVATAAAPHAPALSRTFYEPLLYRDFIQQSLYHPEFGYFNQSSPPIRRLPEPINFNRLLSAAEYRLELARAYKQLQVDWLTPVEVFAPWYGRALAHYMLELRKHDSSIDSSTPLNIVEIGGGTGTLAASVLDYVCEVDPSVYSSMSYTTIEISSSLAAAQQQHIIGERKHSGMWRLVAGDASRLSTWQAVSAQLPRQHSLSGQHTFVLMMEVLDNLPHDRVVRQDLNSPWQQVTVQAVHPAAETAQQQQQDSISSSGSSNSGSRQRSRPQQPPQYSDLLLPATDPLIQSCLRALQLAGSMDGSSGGDGSGGGGFASWLQRALGLEDDQSSQNNVWLPTRCLQLLETLHAAVPRHTLIAADFDALPDIKLAGRNAPLVSGRGEGGRVQDYKSVLVPWGSADIFFPTDFDGLSQLYQAAAGGVSDSSEPAASAGAAGGQQQQTEQQQQQQQGQRQRQVTSSHSSTAEFMSAFAESKQTRTLSGYNPLLQDWPNTRIFMGQAV